MKSSINKQEKRAFIPRSITLTFETQEELDAFGKLFNSTAITDALEEFSGVPIDLYRDFEALGARVSPPADLTKLIKKSFL